VACPLFFLILLTLRGGRERDEALADEFVLRLTGAGGECLLHRLPATRSLLPRRLEFAHVLAVALDLLLLGVGPTREQRFHRNGRRARRRCRRGKVRSKGLRKNKFDHPREERR